MGNQPNLMQMLKKYTPTQLSHRINEFMSQPAIKKNPDFILYLDAKKYCPVIRLADSDLQLQVVQFGSATPSKNKKVFTMVTPKKPVLASGKSYSIFVPSSGRHISIDITHSQKEGKAYASMCVMT